MREILDLFHVNRDLFDFNLYLFIASFLNYNLFAYELMNWALMKSGILTQVTIL